MTRVMYHPLWSKMAPLESGNILRLAEEELDKVAYIRILVIGAHSVLI